MAGVPRSRYRGAGGGLIRIGILALQPSDIWRPDDIEDDVELVTQRLVRLEGVGTQGEARLAREQRLPCLRRTYTGYGVLAVLTVNAGHQSTCRAHCEKCHTQPHGSNPKQTPNSCQKYRTIVGPLECGKRPVLLRSQLNDSYRRTHTGLPSLVSPFRFVSLNRTHVLI